MQSETYRPSEAKKPEKKLSVKQRILSALVFLSTASLLLSSCGDTKGVNLYSNSERCKTNLKGAIFIVEGNDFQKKFTIKSTEDTGHGNLNVELEKNINGTVTVEKINTSFSENFFLVPVGGNWGIAALPTTKLNEFKTVDNSTECSDVAKKLAQKSGMNILKAPIPSIQN